MRSGFQFGEKGTWEFGMHIEKLPTLSGAARKRTTISVAGRNGDLHYIEDAFDNYTSAIFTDSTLRRNRLMPSKAGY